MNKRKIVILSIILLIMVLIIYNNKSITITDYIISSDKVKNEIVIVQISDFHNAKFGEKQNKIVDKIKNSNPDLIVITGDLIDSDNIEESIELIENVVTVAPIYYVTGNHEISKRDSYNRLAEKMKDLGVNILESKVEDINIRDTNITIIGIDDANAINVKEKLDSFNYNKNNFVVLLSHRPELYDEYLNREIDLVFSGHAHGGQFRIPFIGGVIAPHQGFFPKYSEGIFENNDGTKMIVSRGLGNSIIPLRINNNPELVVARIIPS